jgi:hypothetical protein
MSRRAWRTRTISVIAVIGLACGGVAWAVGQAFAAAEMPQTLGRVTAGTCGGDGGNFGAQLLSTAWPGGFTGVPVYSNGSNTAYHNGCENAATSPSGTSITTGTEWQCVELVNRLYVTKGWIDTTWYGDGDQMWNEAPDGLKGVAQGSITYLAPGDVVSIEVQPPPVHGVKQPEESGGHVLIVSAVSGSSITFVSQNAASVITSGTLIKGNLTIAASGNWTYPVDGVVHAPASTGPGGSSPVVRAVATSDGHVQLFDVSNGTIYQNWYSPVGGSIGGGSSAPPMANGAQPAGNPAVVPRSGQPVIDLFVRSSTGQIQETWYNWATGQWGGWIAVSTAAAAGDPQAVATSDGHDQVFIDNNGVIEQNWFSPATGATGDWVVI